MVHAGGNACEVMPLPTVWNDFTFREAIEAVRNEVRIFFFFHFMFNLHYFDTSKYLRITLCLSLCTRFPGFGRMPLPTVWKDFTFKEAAAEAVRNEVRIFSFIHFIFILHYFATSNTNALIFVFLCVRIFQDFCKAFTLQNFWRESMVIFRLKIK